MQDIKLTDLTHKDIQEWMIRGLSHGKFTGVVLTKSIAESVLTARLLSALREKRVDIDETVKAMRKGKDKTKQAIPDKTSEATKFIQPLVDAVVHNLQPFLVTMDQTATSSGDTKEFQDTQHDNAKLRQKLQQAGIPITPVKRKTVQKDTEQALSSPDDEDPNESLPVQPQVPKKRKINNEGKSNPTSSMTPQMYCRISFPSTSRTPRRGCPIFARTSAQHSISSLTPMSTRC